MNFCIVFLPIILSAAIALAAPPAQTSSTSRPTLASGQYVRNVNTYNDTTNIGCWDLTTNAFPVSENETTIWGWVVKTPVNEHVHVTGFEPIVEEGHNELVHHVAIFQCRDLPEEVMAKLAEDRNGTLHWHEYKPNPDPIKYCDAFYMVLNWGAQPYHFPDKVGVPLNKNKDNRYFLFQMHYENVKGESGVKDTSGIRMYYTKTLRQYEGQTQALGVSLGENLVLPPKQDRFTVRGMCSPHCYKDQIPPEGIHIFGSVFHMHSQGRQAIARHFRDGKELEPWMLNTNFTSRRQVMRDLPQELTVLPGDLLSVECTYNTSSKTNATLGGLGGREEMCRIFYMFHPAVTRAITCSTANTLVDTMSAVGVEQLYPNSTIIKKPQNLEGRLFWEYLMSKSEWTKVEVKQLQSMHLRNPQHGYCWIGMSEAFRKPSLDRDTPELVRYPVPLEERNVPQGLRQTQ